MALAIAAALLAVAGIILGTTRNNRPLTLGSAVMLALIIAAWVYFALNPY